MQDSDSVGAELVDAFPFLKRAGRDMQADLAQEGFVARLPAGRFIFMEGDRCVHIALVLAGQARVFKMDENGREITLYRLERGESCILTTSCIMSETVFPALARAETDLTVYMIPAPAFKYWVGRYPAWQQYVFGLLSRRLAHVMALVHEVAFQHMDVRLAGYLAQAGSEASMLNTTHEAIASELGTSREVVSRLLKELEHDGDVSLARGRILIQNLAHLQKKAHS